MVVARFTNYSYDEGEDCSDCGSVVLSFGCDSWSFCHNNFRICIF